MDWREYLGNCNFSSPRLFNNAFFARWGDLDWKPKTGDQVAAGQFHVQLISRVTTQRLGYAAGLESAALSSVYQLFNNARATCEAHPDAHLFSTLTWHILNAHVRPFTAKWHRRSEGGALDALDASDEFRADLSRLQPVLASFADLLLTLRDGKAPPPTPPSASDQRIADEMRRQLKWGIPLPLGARKGTPVDAINIAEKAFIDASRVARGQPDVPHATGLALSGGGIRSATFSLGVLIALARRNILPQFDYLSTVSGGGYLGAFITTFLAARSPGEKPLIGLRSDELPFLRRGGEARALRHLRHNSRYLLTGSKWERFQMAAAQLYGILLNVVAITLLVAAVALADYAARQAGLDAASILSGSAVVLGLVALVLPVTMRLLRPLRARGDWLLAVPGTALAGVLAFHLLGIFHAWAAELGNLLGRPVAIIGLLAAIVVPAGLGALGHRLGRLRGMPVLAAALSVPAVLLALEASVYAWLVADPTAGRAWDLAFYGGILAAVVYGVTDVNFTGLHRHYRNKLAGTFLIQPRRSSGATAGSGWFRGVMGLVKRGLAAVGLMKMDDDPAGDGPGDLMFVSGVGLKLSAVSPSSAGPYPLFNCALNVPGSQDTAMQGRLTDFFLFSPSFLGSPLTGYYPTTEWEAADNDLDISAAMAISGAAASPQMGLKRAGSLSFWLALLNVRLGYWVKKPGTKRWIGPGFRHLLYEMFGTMSEKGRFLNVTDGGHIENLGVYELLKRRCKYIVAVDGEQDPSMTFHALTNLQRLASIDMDITIDVDLDDLRLGASGLSRSHFKFCRILYPEGDTGYLLYTKLSLTGNEGEFIRRYRLDEPEFPHHSTADQFFTEAQYEAYRALGEHVGDKLFLQAIVGDIATEQDVRLDEWFEAIGQSMLDPRSE